MFQYIQLFTWRKDLVVVVMCAGVLQAKYVSAIKCGRRVRPMVFHQGRAEGQRDCGQNVFL